MQAKALELRDRGTFIALLAVDMNPRGIPSESSSEPRALIETAAAAQDAQRWLLRRVGYPCDGKPNVMITYLGGGRRADNDPYGWDDGARTFPVAHQWIIEHWAEIKDGDVIDVEFILGETATKKPSERDAGDFGGSR
jgi:hypothetical protein